MGVGYGAWGMGHRALAKQGFPGNGERERGKGERLNLSLYPLPFTPFPLPYLPNPFHTINAFRRILGLQLVLHLHERRVKTQHDVQGLRVV